MADISGQLASLGQQYNSAMSSGNTSLAAQYHQAANNLRSQNGQASYYDSNTDRTPSSSNYSGTGTPNSTGMSRSNGGNSVQPSGTYGGNGTYTPFNSVGSTNSVQPSGTYGANGSYTPSNGNSSYAQNNSGYNFNLNNANASQLMTELGRAQTAWNQYNSANDTARANDAASYGQQLRSRLTSLGYNAGNQDYRGLWNQYAQQNGISGAATPYVQSSNPNANYQTLTTQQAQPYAQPQMTQQQMMQQWLMQQMQQPVDYAQLQQMAQQQAQQAYSQQQAQYNNLMSQLNASQTNSLGQVDNSTQDAKSALENQYFQNYLGARQAMADRGLAGSGLANDQDTRLLLAKQQDLAGIYRDAELQKNDINSQFTNEQMNAMNALNQVNPDITSQQIYQSLLANANDSANKRLSSMAPFMQYFMQTPNNAADNQTKLDTTNADNLNKLYTTAMNNGSSTYNNTMDNQVKTALGMLPYQYQTANNKADNATKAVTNAIDMFKAQNQASYQNGMLNIDGQRLSLDQAKFADSKDRFATEIQQKADALKNTQWNQQAQHQASLAKGYLDQAAAYQKQLSGMDSSDPMYSSVKANYDSAMQNATNAYNGLASLNNGGDGSDTTDTSTAGFPTSGTPSGSFSNFLVGQ